MFPTIKALASILSDHKPYIDKGEWLDVRLRVTDGGWSVHTGDASYDQDHRGWWGCSSLSRSSNCRDVARELIEQAREDHAMSQPDEQPVVATLDSVGKPLS